jgi:rubrerythrin
MDKKILIARLRQLQTVDRNALAIYTELAESAKDAQQHKIFSGIAQDEKRHVVLGKEMLSLLES